jgi:hypothetical protein
MLACLTLFALAHASASGGACGDSTLVAKVALVRAPIEHAFGLHLSIMPPKKARLGRTGKGAKSKEGALQPSQRDARDLEAARRASLEPPELDEEVVDDAEVANLVVGVDLATVRNRASSQARMARWRLKARVEAAAAPASSSVAAALPAGVDFKQNGARATLHASRQAKSVAVGATRVLHNNKLYSIPQRAE